MPAGMRRVLPLVLLVACSKTAAPPGEPAAPAAPAAPGEPAAPAAAPAEVLAADAARTTVAGNTFLAPAGWSLSVKGSATILQAPEADSWIVLVDVQADRADQAVERAWAAYAKDRAWPLKVVHPGADKDGWTDVATYEYTTSPNERRGVVASTRRANGTWTVAISDVSDATGEKRRSQVSLIFGQLLPKGFARESFAGKPAHRLDAARIAALSRFVTDAQAKLRVPGVSLGLVQDGEVVFSGGFGVREVGKPAKVDGDTKYIIASNTKALTTLMLAKLVDERKLTWDTAAATLLPGFALGDADTTRKVQVKHLICACTGMPRQDMEWLFEYGDLTPGRALAALARMQPTSEFGALFQYSNPLAAAAGFVGGHVLYPELELGKAYDQAMQTRVFGPLGMTSTTFDFKRAQTGNYARAHAHDLQDRPTTAIPPINSAIVPLRPAGGAWSSVNDVLKYVRMELAGGVLPDGARYIDRDVLLARRAPQVAIGRDTSYGMGLTVHTRWGVTVVNHGGDLTGFHSDMMWLPEHGVGAVILTSGDPGWLIRGHFRRKLLEVLFDGAPEADRDLAAAAESYFAGRAAERKDWVLPPDPTVVAGLAAKYRNPELGEISVRRAGAAATLDLGEWNSEVATKRNPDGSTSLVTTAAGMDGLEFVVGAGPTLTIRDAQHEYVFTAQ
jgi:CubicO group peptidase (beta-lactamase class C family)